MPVWGENPDHLALGAGGIGEGTEQVEDGAKAELAPHRAGEAHGGVVRDGKQEADAHFRDAAPHLLRRDFKLHASGFEHVGAAALAGHAAVAVLGDVSAGGGGHEGRGGGDVEALRPTAAAGAAGVHEVRHVHLHLGGDGAHGGGGAGDLCGGFAAGGKGGEDAADLGGCGFAGEDEVEDGGGLGLRKRLAGDEDLQSILEVHGVALFSDTAAILLSRTRAAGRGGAQRGVTGRGFVRTVAYVRTFGSAAPPPRKAGRFSRRGE